MKFDVDVIYDDAISGLKTLEDKSVYTIITSPPYYGLRDYGVDGQIGLEKSPEEYIARLVAAFDETKRVLRDDGTLWVVIGDSYAGSGKGAAQYPDNALKYKQGTNKGMLGAGKTAAVPKMFEGIKRKDLIGIPWMFAFAMRASGWYLRQDIIWQKPNPMPESVKDRCTKCHEYIFLFSKSEKYYFDSEAISEPVAAATTRRLQQNISEQAGSARAVGKTNGNMKAVAPRYGENRNKRDVWNVSTTPFKGAHFAVFPEKLILPCILAGCPIGGTVLDPFAGSGTTLKVARDNGRHAIGIELNKAYKPIIENRVGMEKKKEENINA